MILFCRTLEHHLQNIECNSTSAVAITHHFLAQLVRTHNLLLLTSKPKTTCLDNNRLSERRKLDVHNAKYGTYASCRLTRSYKGA